MVLSYLCVCVCVCVCVCADGKDNRWTVPGSLSIQPCIDQLCHRSAARQPERGGEAAVVVPGSKLDAPTVSANSQTAVSLFKKHEFIFSRKISHLFQQLIVELSFFTSYWIHILPVDTADRCASSNVLCTKYELLISLE